MGAAPMSEPRRFAFTRARLDAEEKPKKGRKIIWDEEVGGLCCRITSEGDKSLWLSKWADGGQRWVRIGSHPECSVKDARTLALGLLARIAKGERPWEARQALRKEATLQDLWDHHAEHAKGRKRQGTLALYNSAWAKLGDLHKRRLGSIRRGDVQRVVDRIGGQYPVMANRVHSLVGVLYATAKAADLWKGDNPAVGVTRFRELSRDRYLKPDELRAWWLSLEYEPETWRIYFAVAVLCGARKGNVLRMRWADLDLKRGVWRVPGEEAKAGEPLTVVLVESLVALLTDWRFRCDSPTWVFPTPEAKSRTPHVADPKRPWARVVNRASLFRLVAELARLSGWDALREGQERTAALVEADRLRVLALGRREAIPDEGNPLSMATAHYAQRVRDAGGDPAPCMMDDVRVHDLRRTLGSWATITGASLPIVGRALGHSSLSATQVYARLSMDPVRDAVETATDAIMEHGGEAAARVLGIAQETQVIAGKKGRKI